MKWNKFSPSHHRALENLQKRYKFFNIFLVFFNWTTDPFKEYLDYFDISIFTYRPYFQWSARKMSGIKLFRAKIRHVPSGDFLKCWYAGGCMIKNLTDERMALESNIPVHYFAHFRDELTNNKTNWSTTQYVSVWKHTDKSCSECKSSTQAHGVNAEKHIVPTSWSWEQEIFSGKQYF